MLSWLAIDCVLVRCALTYDRLGYNQPVRDQFGSLLFAGAAVAFLANALFPYYFWEATECTIAHGMLLQVSLHTIRTFRPAIGSILTRTLAGPPLVVLGAAHPVKRFDARTLARHLGSPLRWVAACLLARSPLPPGLPQVPPQRARESSDNSLPRWRPHVPCRLLVGARVRLCRADSRKRPEDKVTSRLGW